MVSYCKRSSAEWFIEQLNVENAKLLAFVLVIGFIGYHGILHLRYGSDSCTWLLSSGRYKGDHEWQPYGCMLHKYTKTDARRCLRYLAFWGKYNSFAFIGDSRLEQLYEHFIGVLKTRLDVETSFSTVDHRTNYTYMDRKLRLSVTFIPSNDVSRTMVEQFRNWQHSEKPPSVIVATTGLQLLKTRNTTDVVLEEYKRNLTHLVQAIDSLTERNTQVLWKLMESVDQSKLKNDMKRINNADIDSYNKAAVEILTHSAAKLWSSPRLVASGATSDDGASISPTALRHTAQILLNMFCNDHMNFNDGSCCAQPEPCTQLQLWTFAVLFACAVYATISWVRAWWRGETGMVGVGGAAGCVGPGGGGPSSPGGPPPLSPAAALGRLGAIMAYFYLCDRTNFFMKENKYYSEWSFWLPVGYVFALGLFFTEASKSSKILHREQTDEWKGWMQLVILIYQVTGASKVLPIYILVRTLVSAYLFLTGYGHFYYTWKTGDTSLVRYLRVMFRLNFLTVVLCLTMNRPYQFYSFIPLVSFWYTLMFVIFALPPHITQASSHTVETRPYQYLYIVLKVIGLLTIVTVLYMSEVFFQKIFVTRPWKALFVNSDDDIHQWWLRWKQDRYSLAYGVIFGLARLAARALEPRPAAAPLALGALAALGTHTAFALACASAAACAEVLSYSAWLPLCGLAVARNVSASLRARHSALFAWVGGVALELCAGRAHAWLAADAHGVLVLLPAAPALNLLLSGFVLLCAAHELRRLTAALLPRAVPPDPKRALRNFMLFLAVLAPIGVHQGMF